MKIRILRVGQILFLVNEIIWNKGCLFNRSDSHSLRRGPFIESSITMFDVPPEVRTRNLCSPKESRPLQLPGKMEERKTVLLKFCVNLRGIEGEWQRH